MTRHNLPNNQQDPSNYPNSIFTSTTSGQMPVESEQDIQNRLDAERVTLQVVSMHEKNTPKNTTNAYRGKQKKFDKWCREVLKFHDGFTVTEQKLLFWIEHVTNVGNTKAREADQYKPLGLETIKMHTKAILRLWVIQRLRSPMTTLVNHPRGNSIMILESNLAKVCYDNKVKHHLETGVNTFQDGYTYSQYIELSMHYFSTKKGQTSYRDRMAFLCNHAMILCGESMHGVSLQYCSYMALPNEADTLDTPVTRKLTPAIDYPYCLEVPCLFWAKRCLIVSSITTLSKIDRAEQLDSLAAIGIFLCSQKVSIAHLDYGFDNSTMQLLYKVARIHAEQLAGEEAEKAEAINSICDNTANQIEKIKRRMQQGDETAIEKAMLYLDMESIIIGA